MQLQVNELNDYVNIKVPGGNEIYNETQQKFVQLPYHNQQIADIIQSYAKSDLCIIGPRGSGKSMLVSEIARMLNQTLEPMVLYQDMTARDFIQQRTTTITGDTIWQDSPLVRAARSGYISVLDGIHRVHNSTISFLHRFVLFFTSFFYSKVVVSITCHFPYLQLLFDYSLVHEREIQLYDGTRLLRHDKYDELLKTGSTVNDLNMKGVFRIHPAFRIIALGEPPTGDTINSFLLIFFK